MPGLRFLRCALGPLGLTLLGLATGVAAETNEALDHFEREVRPVLVASCLKCHGEKKQEGDLRLDSRSAAMKGGTTGPAIIPGEPEKSLLIAAIRHMGDVKMPPNGKLTDAQIEAVSLWVKNGAPWPAAPLSGIVKPDPSKHWAFLPIKDPPAPASGGNPVDAFIAQQLATSGLSGSPPADARTLIRRANYDLLGLPPTAEEVEQFAAAYSQAPAQAYEALVERLLNSPHYGEHWARHWLDVARYSDTKGYIYAREQRVWTHAWAYRDWVVKALNDDLPYNRFLLLQIAADQAAPDDASSQAAMGFLTIGRRFLGVTHDIIDDRIDVVTRGTMGLTVGCARCHDHKYDPIPTRDYYSLYGVFQSCVERRVPVSQPLGADEARQAFAAELANREKKLADTLAIRREEWGRIVRGRIADYLIAQTELGKYPEEGFDQVFSKADILPAFVRRWLAYLDRAERQNDNIFIAWRAFRGIPAAEFAQKSAEVTGKLAELPANEFHPLIRQRFVQPPASLQDVAERYATAFAEIDKLWQAELKAAVDQQRPAPLGFGDANVEELRQVLYGATAPCEVPDEPIVNIESYFDLGSCTELWGLQNQVDVHVLNSPHAPPQAVILSDREQPAAPRVFKRGNPAQKGDAVPRQFVELLRGPAPQPFAHGSGRLELAQAIIDPQNPLTPRVMVNRVWMHHFGAGLVRTPSDFGVRAEIPSHPELLDWLTTRFIQEGWSLKQLHRRIMLSAAYCQSSAGPSDVRQLAKAQQVDPQNRLLWRMSQRRLTAEEMRDSLLSAAGVLDRTLGGKPVDAYTGAFRRRALYGQVDRQFLPSALRVFDFANPDLHIPQRSETTVPQQALFFLNHRLLIDNATLLSRRAPEAAAIEERVRLLYRWAYQREPTPEQAAAAVVFLQAAANEPGQVIPPTVNDWQYGFGAVNEQTGRLDGFTRLPHFTGVAWQGGPAWPDAKLGWAQLTAAGGHAGDDRAHAAVRRWVAPRELTVRIRSKLLHETPAGDGVRGFLLHSSTGRVGAATVHNTQADFNVDSLSVKPGDTLDFCVDIGGTLNNDQFTWEVAITSADAAATTWSSSSDFSHQGQNRLSPWPLLAQVLLSANEFVFVD